MPSCAVPNCKNTEQNSEYSFFRFPTDEKLRKSWLSRIRRGGDFVYTPELRICSWHFPNGKQTGPIKFQWNKEKSFDIHYPESPRPARKSKPQPQVQPPPPPLPQPPQQPQQSNVGETSPEPVTEERLSSRKRRKQTLVPRTDEHLENEAFIEDNSQESTSSSEELKIIAKCKNLEKEVGAVRLENNTLHKTIQQLQITIKELEAQLINAKKKQAEPSRQQQDETRTLELLTAENINMKIQLNFLQDSNTSLQNLISDLEEQTQQSCKTICRKFDMDKIKNLDAELLSSLTGMRDFSSIEFLIQILQRKGMIYTKNVEILTLEYQVLITMIKIRLDLPQNVLGYLFGVSQATVSRVFDTVIESIHQVFYCGDGPLSKIPSRHNTATSLPKCFSQMPNCRIVIDCTEFQMETPAKLVQKKAVYSHYKSHYTMKVLVGCAPNGTVVFVSSLYGGSESDKSIVVQSKLMDQMESGDLILADKGFQLHDILPPGVSLNIPSFLVHNQFTVNEILQNNMYATARVIIERLNAKFKIFKILNVIRANDRERAEKIVKVCIALTTLMPTLMKEVLQ